MLQKIMTYMARFHMIEPGDRIVAGVSGGADSICLFHVLCELKKSMEFSLEVVHVDHGIRKEAGDDAAFVRKLCAEHGIPFVLVREDVSAYARKKHISVEEAGREVRYRAFEQLCKIRSAAGIPRSKIAVAHHMDDRAETVLFRLFRGSGIHGLVGMEPVRAVFGGEERTAGAPEEAARDALTVIRPLLCVTRGEIETWLGERGIKYCTDATNDTDHYARNRIRRHILPYAQEAICQRSAEHIAQTADKLLLAADYLDAQTKEAFLRCVTEQDGALLVRGDVFDTLHPYLQGSLIHFCFDRLIPHAKDISSVHVADVCGLFAKQTGRRISLPHGAAAQRVYEGVRLSGGHGGAKRGAGEDARRRGEKEKNGGAKEGVYLSPDEENPAGTVFFAGLRVDYRVFAYDGERQFPEGIPKNDFTKWFDYGKIRQPLCFRFRRQGDVFTIAQTGETKSLKKYMIDRKIPADERGSCPLLADAEHILWVIGYRIGEEYKVSVQTKKVIEIHVSGGKCNG